MELLVKLWSLQQKLWGRHTDKNKVLKLPSKKRHFFHANKYFGFFAGLAQVQDLLAVALLVLEAHLKTPTATTNAVLVITPFLLCFLNFQPWMVDGVHGLLGDPARVL